MVGPGVGHYMKLTVKFCPTHGAQLQWWYLGGSQAGRCYDCQAPLESGPASDVPSRPWGDDVGTEPPAPPGEGGAADGGPPWPNLWDGMMYGIRFVQAPDSDDPSLVHRQVYVIDPARPQDDPLHLHLAAMTVCLLPGPYVRPASFTRICDVCRSDITLALAEAQAVLLAMQVTPGPGDDDR